MTHVQGGHSKAWQEAKGFQFHRDEQQNVFSEVRFGVPWGWGDRSVWLQPGGLEMAGGGLWWMLEQLQPCPTKASVPAPTGAQGCVPQPEFMEV